MNDNVRSRAASNFPWIIFRLLLTFTSAS